MCCTPIWSFEYERLSLPVFKQILRPGIEWSTRNLVWEDRRPQISTCAHCWKPFDSLQAPGDEGLCCISTRTSQTCRRIWCLLVSFFSSLWSLSAKDRWLCKDWSLSSHIKGRDFYQSKYQFQPRLLTNFCKILSI